MIRHTGARVRGTAMLILLVVALGQSVEGQSLHSVFEARAHVFPTVGPGVTVLKRDSYGHYYILAEPATVVSIYGLDGNLIGRIPNANSQGASIRYAVDMDLNSDGLLFVADRGANAVEVFNPDGSLVAKIPVLAPTSVVALPSGQFAVTTLTSKRLVQILDEKGQMVRSFGDPAFLEEDSGKKPLAHWGKIVGSPAGDIYFAFTSVPDPIVRKYDRYGYVSYEASVPETFFETVRTAPNDRVEVRLNLTHLSLSDQTSGWISMGSSGDVKFGGGVGTGLSRIFGSGGGFGRAGMASSAAQPGFANTPGGALSAGSLGGTFSGQVASDGTQFQFGAGNISSLRGGRQGRNGAFTNNSNFDQPAPQGSTLQFFGARNDDADQYTGPSNSQVLSFTGAGSGPQGGTSGESDAAADSGQDLGLSAGTMFNSVVFQTQGPSAIIGGGFPGGGLRFAHPNLGGSGERASYSGAHFGEPHFGPHGRFGAGESDFTATLRLNLGDLGGNSVDKPVITATGVDPSTGDLWAAIGDTLIHFSREGNPVEVYYLTMKGGVPLKPSAVLVEPDRFLIATDLWGIFEFARTQ